MNTLTQAEVDALFDMFGIGSEARTFSILRANIENTLRHAACLHAVEREFFMVPGEVDEDYPDDEPSDECLLNWGATPEQYVEDFRTALRRLASAGDGCHGLDTPERVCFYEQDFYVLSNFSAFAVKMGARIFPTSEHAYHYRKFPRQKALQHSIWIATSAHEAFKITEAHKAERRSDWDNIKLDVMREIIRAKAEQHEYVRRKLLATGDRELVENSWRDDYWGWGPNRDGQNWLGKLWMELRAELRAIPTPGDEQPEGAKAGEDK